MDFQQNIKMQKLFNVLYMNLVQFSLIIFCFFLYSINGFLPNISHQSNFCCLDWDDIFFVILAYSVPILLIIDLIIFFKNQTNYLASESKYLHIEGICNKCGKKTEELFPNKIKKLKILHCYQELHFCLDCIKEYQKALKTNTKSSIKARIYFFIIYYCAILVGDPIYRLLCPPIDLFLNFISTDILISFIFLLINFLPLIMHFYYIFESKIYINRCLSNKSNNH